MTDWIANLTVLQAVLAVLVVVVPVAWRYALRPSIAFARRINAGLVKLDAFDPVQFATCVAEVARIRVAIEPNGGHSLYDKVSAAGKAAQLGQARLSTMLDVVVERPMFEADEKGDFTWVNAAFEKTFETSCDAMGGRGFINLILPEDRDRFIRDWRHAVQDRRPFITMVRYLTMRSGTHVTGRCSAQPITDEVTEKAIAWMGAIDPVDGRRPQPPAVAS